MTAEPFVPPKHDYASLDRTVQGCRGCPLYIDATQAVFGEGPTPSRLMLIGEQPGDQEDVSGHPFVGPAGRILDQALSAAGIERSTVYLTNAVKHFKWTRARTGNRRLHAKPARAEVVACQPWLIAEIDAVSPEVLVCLGATAAQSLMGSSFRITQSRGQLFEFSGRRLMATLHPSAVLRMRSREERHEALDMLIKDLKLVA